LMSNLTAWPGHRRSLARRPLQRQQVHDPLGARRRTMLGERRAPCLLVGL
jgi:hypothetical protein